jgi:hypothetical protein
MEKIYLTFEELTYLINKYKIPHNVRLLSDSGWECSATDMCGVYYNKQRNIIVFTQEFNEFEKNYTQEYGWIKLIGE